MLAEIYAKRKIAIVNKLDKIKRSFSNDYRTKSSIRALQGIFNSLPNGPFCLSIGGGPKRAHHGLTNLNIEPYQNVEVVGDAHALPFLDESVDAIHCEAVMEHLSDPILAVKEMHRVLKRHRRAYICTPFLQAYHGYPCHYQNYTLLGHTTLFKDQGFKIIDSGTCVGPVNTIVTLISRFIGEYFPSMIRLPSKAAWHLIGIFLKPLDKIINKKANAHVLASTTYLLVEK